MKSSLRYIFFINLFFIFRSLSVFEEKLPIEGCDYRLHHLHSGDLEKGMGELLEQLTFLGMLQKREFEEFRFKLTPHHIVLVIEDFAQHKIVASGTLLVEHKLIHECGFVGHIEDIATHSSVRGKGLGKLIVTRLAGYAQALGCYKTILDCSEKNVPFYERCSFNSCGIEMEKR